MLCFYLWLLPKTSTQGTVLTVFNMLKTVRDVKLIMLESLSNINKLFKPINCTFFIIIKICGSICLHSCYLKIQIMNGNAIIDSWLLFQNKLLNRRLFFYGFCFECFRITLKADGSLVLLFIQHYIKGAESIWFLLHWQQCCHGYSTIATKTNHTTTCP